MHSSGKHGLRTWDPHLIRGDDFRSGHSLFPGSTVHQARLASGRETQGEHRATASSGPGGWGCAFPHGLPTSVGLEPSLGASSQGGKRAAAEGGSGCLGGGAGRGQRLVPGPEREARCLFFALCASTFLEC